MLNRTAVIKKLAILCCLLSFQFCYLEWGGDNAFFIFEVAYQVMFEKGKRLDSFLHPAILLPWMGQLLLLFALIQKEPGKQLTIAGIVMMGILVLLLLFIGILSRNVKITLATIPFIASTVWCLRLMLIKRSNRIHDGFIHP